MNQPSKQAAELEALIRRSTERGEASLASILPLVYDELRALAARQLARQRPDHTLQPTALINEAYLRLAGQDYESWKDRREFVMVAATVMRRVLVDYARRRHADKRPQEKQRVDIDESAPGQSFGLELVAIDEVLEQLAEIDERQAQIVELRYFAGLSMEETAETMELSRSTVAREWRMARAWLRRRLSEHELNSD
ncbi:MULTISPECIES: ECF-type sigma factor [unclassified Wenzhouxiangella]|uniref:ECF-type sigma factor n=1 Tax=unclassified Wenzhouxiangella TaxID=2613841 RepID=UPI000E32ADE5|nr:MULTISPECIES: ECF-type sigma factor [unclassified Wenzhouxiangella]RFF27544.1 sigma-70 family RNA polymerase sigma factor [Wenzhouxiangella sp. 15181]RFP69594.1 sigma-70 family RNA polymerase sigma factor [Wenzhouxiangella sp. 15190]